MGKKDVVHNALFVIEDVTDRLIIPENGFYEITASFHFNSSTSVMKYKMGAVTLGVVEISDNNEQYIAATRQSFDQDNQDLFSRITVYPTIVYLQQGVVIAPAIRSGLIGNVLLSCVLGCDRKNKDCVSFPMNIKLISDEDAYQKYY